MSNNLKNVHFHPWKGENYEKGINGKKILVLGESHYWSEEIYEGVVDDLQKGKYIDFTKGVIKSYIEYQKGKGEHCSWMNSFTKFSNGVYNWAEDRPSPVEFWESVLFYNYVQFPISETRTAPTPEEFEESKPAFFEVLEAYQPDIIIVWGQRLWDAMPNNGEYVEGLSLNDGKGFYYYDIKGKKIPAVRIYHPSSSYFSSSIEDIKIALDNI